MSIFGNAPIAESADYLVGMEQNRPVLVRMDDRRAVYQDPVTGALVGVDGIGVGDAINFADLAASTLPIGSIVNVAGIAPSPVPFERTGFGWRPAASFGMQPLRGDYTHTDSFNDVGIAWQAVLPAGLLNWGYVAIEPLVTFPSSASTKNITLRVNGTSFWNKARTTSTHECPLIVVQARDNGMVNNPYWTNNGYASGGTSWATSNLAIDTTAAVELSLQVGFSAAGAGSESIVVRYVRARFFPY